MKKKKNKQQQQLQKLQQKQSDSKGKGKNPASLFFPSFLYSYICLSTIRNVGSSCMCVCDCAFLFLSLLCSHCLLYVLNEGVCVDLSQEYTQTRIHALSLSFFDFFFYDFGCGSVLVVDSVSIHNEFRACV